MENVDMDEILIKIDRAIKEIWLNEIKDDFNNSYILYEDTLKNAFYYHLRIKLKALLKKNNIRIFTEFHDGPLSGKRLIADIAIVKISDSINDHIKNNIEKLYAIIELKHKAKRVSIDYFISDLEKVTGYIKDKKLKGCQFYLGFIHEEEYDADELTWIQNEKQEKIVEGRLTELSANFYKGQDEILFTNISYNGMNRDLGTGFPKT